jgi:hypothetical protein
MNALTVVACYDPDPLMDETIRSLGRSPLVEALILLSRAPVDGSTGKTAPILCDAPLSQRTIHSVLEGSRSPYLLFLPHGVPFSMEPGALERMVAAAEAGAAIVYSDYYEDDGGTKRIRPLLDYRPGSVRDDFDFGTAVLFSLSAARKAREVYGLVPAVSFAGLYDLRLKVSIDRPVLHIAEPLYTVKGRRPEWSERLFTYVDPSNEGVQKEMEAVFTDYLRKIDAYVARRSLRRHKATDHPFPVEASVVIPVRNRRETIAEAIESGLSQETDFPFNVIVVDNHSTDGTTEVLKDLSARARTLHHLIPPRTDLAIGGCWNEAVGSPVCGRYAVQLDSDDFYQGPHTLQRMVDMFRTGGYAMVIGAYRLVDFKLNEIPPGLIDHREWTDENGHNNALRVNGLGAPRAFSTELMRQIGFLNVSYGEDYAASLRISREYRIGRIYESLYLCRRWSGNTDAALDVESANRNDAFKDEVRTVEILARQRMNRGGG